MRNASSKASPWERRIVLVGCVVACCTLALHCRSKPSDGPGGGPDARAGGRAIEPGAPLGQVADERQENEEGGRGARSANDERTMGARSAEDVDRMAGVAGPKDNPNPHMARTVMREAPGAGAAGPRDNPNPHMARTVMREAPGADGSAPAIAHGFATRSGGGSGVGFSRGAVRRTSRSSRGRGDDCGRNATPFDCPDVDEFLIVEAPEPARESDPGEPPPPTQGTLRAKNAEGEEAGDFPLEHTEVTSEVSGMIARTTVEQIYGNPFSEVIEAVYVFPLPALGAVNDFVMQVGDRKIVGLIRPRAEAERIYAEARAAGHTASLLTQERSNIFTQSVANIEPGGKVTIEITYFERLVYESGYYEWVFPMVVGPRYIPGEPTTPASDDPDAPSSAGGGTSPSTTQVGDADRITPPVLPPDRRSGHDISLTVTLDAGLPIARLAVPTHQVETQDLGAGKRVVKLAAADTIPNRDLVLRWSVAGAETQFGVLAHRGDAGGYLTLVMQPPAEPTDEQVVPREITFLIDISGSMSGVPLGIAAAVVRETLDRLRPDDRYNIVVFAGGNGQLWESARPKTDGNVAAARGYIEELCGGGGTEMLEGVRHALKAEHDPAALQMYVFVTDIWSATRCDHRAGQERARRSQVLHVRHRSSVNRYLVDGIAEFGGGASDVVLRPGEAEGCRATRRLLAMIDSRCSWTGRLERPVADAYPSRLPDLFAGQTVSLVARFTGAGSGTAYVTGRVGSRRVRYPVSVVLPEREEANAALAPLWARWRIEDLSKLLIGAGDGTRAELEQQITDLAVEFRLVTVHRLLSRSTSRASSATAGRCASSSRLNCLKA